MEKKGESKEQPKTTYKAYSVDLNAPCSNKLLTVESAQKYLQTNFKVNGLKMREGNKEGKGKDGKEKPENRPIKVSSTDKSDKRKNTLIIQVDNKLKFSKRYIKYLVKKFLRREGISRYLTVSSTSPNAYTVKVIKKNEE